MAGGPADDGSTYSPMVAAIYVFNLIVGAGALAMPKAFAQSGYIAGAVMIAVLAFMSFMTVTFMIEAMAAANAFMRRNEEKKNSINNGTSTLDRYDAKTPLINARAETDSEFSIVSRAEMGAMAELFFPSWGVKAFYACIIIYLYGDLCIYAVAVPKSLKSVTCPVGHNATSNHSGHVTHYTTVPPPCLGSLDADASYRVYLLMFALLLGPFTFFNVQKTKWLQLFTTVMRWSTFLLMIIIAIIGLAGTQVFTPPEPVPEPESVSVADIKNLPALFGVSIYSFMCHHSLPSLLTPMTRKSTLNTVMVADFALILGFYCLLCFTAVFRFQASTLEDLYTLNFKHFNSGFVSYFLGLFPVFTLSANFPIIAITLRNNLKLLLSSPSRKTAPWVEKFVFPLLAIGPPIIVAFFTDNVELLVGVTGSYAGVGIQYVIPAMLAYCARGKVERELSDKENHHRSWFSHNRWIWFAIGWSVACIALVTFNHIYEGK
eukprot:TRINITY_DN11078_c0_g2_i1.p1 TRINITY_DN11078_c0_g2~~TRINITY_DN11078_c0_g2_i1.p1  ORF type:complete len:489 (+),score=94.76 TRINITY_DN11078_c0_g2_i1:191-1657(+)